MLVHESKSNDNCMRHNAVMELIFPIMRMCGQRENLQVRCSYQRSKARGNSCQNVLMGTRAGRDDHILMGFENRRVPNTFVAEK